MPHDSNNNNPLKNVFSHLLEQKLESRPGVEFHGDLVGGVQ